VPLLPVCPALPCLGFEKMPVCPLAGSRRAVNQGQAGGVYCEQMFNSKSTGLILAICSSGANLVWPGYCYYQDQQQEAARERINAGLVRCEQQADIYLQQYNATSLLPGHDGYLTEYNDAIALCKQEH